MKLNKKPVVCGILLLILFLCINVACAVEHNNETFATEDVIGLTANEAGLDSDNSLKDDNSNEGTIYVSETGNDLNDGKNRTNAVATIEKALEITTNGQIVLLAGTHRTNDLGIISDNLTITGEGKAVIDAGNNNRILYVGEDAHVLLKNVIMINGYSIDESGALLGNSNVLTLINCTLANSSAGENNGGAIFNVGKLTITNTTISNCSAKRGGAVYTQTSGEDVWIDIFNSTFENNIASGFNEQGGGAVYVQRTYGFYNFRLTVDNTRFTNNKAQGESCGGAIALVMLDATVKINNCQFISNHANGKDAVGGGAIYTTGADNYQRYGTMTITGTLFENNTCNANGGAIFAKTTTVAVSNSVLINNSDAKGISVYGFKTDLSSPSITLNDNWWASNDSPKNLVGGNNRYSPTINRWAVLTVTNDTPIVEGNTVKLTVSINNYTTGSSNGVLSKPIIVSRDVIIKTGYGDISGTLENGEFITDYIVPDNLKYIICDVDSESQVLYVVVSPVTIQIDEISGKRFDRVSVIINVTSDIEVNDGYVELYVGSDKISSFEVKNSQASGDVIISNEIGTYNLTAKYVGGAPLFEESEVNSTLTVEGITGLYNDTFFNFFDDEGVLRDEYAGNELVFHGDFSGLGIDTITIARPLVIIGDNARLYDISLSLLSEDTKVSEMAFVMDKGGAAISVANGDVEINEVFINCTAPDTVETYAVLASYASNFRLTNSTIIFFSGNAGAVHHALHISGSDNICIEGNVINASLPARDVDWHSSEPFFDSINQDLVLAIGIQDCNGGILSKNEINVEANGARGFTPTIDSIILYGVSNFEISWNNITQTDTVNAGEASYSNAIDLYAFNGVTIRYNNILVNTTSGLVAKGTAYPIQATGPYNALTIDHNNLTSISNGPALGIYSQNFDGVTDITITFNNIDVTGFTSESENALVSGMELQDTNAKVYNNTIFSKSKGSYDELNSLYGISYSQYTGGVHTYDIKDNTVYTEGKYAVYLMSAKDSYVVNNLLFAHDLKADSAVYIAKSNATVVENNRPGSLKLIIAVENVTVGSDAIINITSDENVNGVITVIINNKTYGNYTFNGNKMITVSNLPLGDYNVTVIFKSGEIGYDECENSTKFNVVKLQSRVILNADFEIKVGQETVISVNVTQGATGIVNVNVNGTDYPIYLNQTTSFSHCFDEAGLYFIIASYSGDDTYDGSVSENMLINVSEKFDVDIKIEVPDVIKIGDSIVIGTQTNTDGNLTIKINGVEINGTYVIPSNDTYVVTVESEETDMYKAGFSSLSFDVFKQSSSVNISFVPARSGEKSLISVEVNEGAEGIVVVNVGGMEYPINVSDKKLELVLYTGEYNVSAAYMGDDKFNKSMSEVKTLTVLDKLDANIKIEVPDVVKIGDTIVINAEMDSDGNITIKINDVEINGTYTIKSNGTYVITVESAETADYKKGFVTKSLVVSKESSGVEVTVIAGNALEESKIIVKVTSGANGNVTVRLNNTEVYKGPVNQTNLVSLGNLSEGNYIVNVTYLADDYYNGSCDVKEFRVFKSKSSVFASPIEIVEGETAKLTVNVNNGASGKVIVVINGNEYHEDISNNVATVNISGLIAGRYDVNITYCGDEKYDSSLNATSVVVKKLMSNDDFNIVIPQQSNSPKFTVRLPFDATGKLTVIVDGKMNYTKDLVGGVAEIEVSGLSSGKHDVQVIYSGDDKYAGVFKSTVINIGKSPIVKVAVKFIAKKKTFKAKTKVKKYKVTLKAGKNPVKNVWVTLKIKGKTFKAKTNAKGKATFKIKKLTKKGKYNAVIKFSGNGNYLKAIKKVRITVKK